MKISNFVLAGLVLLLGSTASTHAHYDIAPYFTGDGIQTGGLTHEGVHIAPPLNVYGYEFGEDPYDPFNPTDPGVNQQSGVGNLPAGAPLYYNIVSGLRYWDGTGEAAWGAPPGDTRIVLSMNAQSRTITGESPAQEGGLVQTVASNGSVHKHFVTSLLASAGASNIPGTDGYLEPAAGLYAVRLELILVSGGASYLSQPFWVVFNHGASEEVHELAMTSLVPEPGAMSLFIGAAALLGRRRR